MSEGKKSKNKRRLIRAGVFLFTCLLSAGVCYKTSEQVENYRRDIERESSVESQIANLQTTNNDLTNTINNTGKELVSFSEDKIRYINLASTLAAANNVKTSKLRVSDIWTEGQMSVMTATVEVEGTLKDVSSFLQQYCGDGSTNRINVISCRPNEEHVWVQRQIDGEKILTWFSPTDEAGTAGVASANNINWNANAAPATGDGTETVPSITLADLFAPKEMKVYVEVDFLGRT